jgi:hypothetical protein
MAQYSMGFAAGADPRNALATRAAVSRLMARGYHAVGLAKFYGWDLAVAAHR